MKRGALLILAALAAVVVHSCGGDDAPVAPPPPANRPPVATGTIPAARMLVGDTVTVILTSYFSDPDNDRLTYTATVSNSTIATATVSGNFLTVTGLASGDAVVTVTARDPGGLSARQQMGVDVDDRFGYVEVVIQHNQVDLGAVVLAVEGPQIDSVRAAPDLILYGAATDRGLRAFVAGAIPQSGALLTFWVDDLGRMDEYDARLEQAAATTYNQRPLDGARVMVAPKRLPVTDRPS